VGARGGRGDGVPVGQQLGGGGGGGGGDLGGAGGGLHVPGLGGAQDGSAHDVATFSRPRRRSRSNSVSSRRARAMARSSRRDSRPGVTPRKSLVAGGPHCARPDAVIGAQPGSRVLSNRSPSLKCSTRNPSGSRQ